MLIHSPLALHPFIARHTPRAEGPGVDLCELLSDGLCRTGETGAVRVVLPNQPIRCAGRQRALQQLVSAMLAMAQRQSPQGLDSELKVECLATHLSLTVTSDRVTQTPELGPLFEAFNAYSASLSKQDTSVAYTPRMKIVSCADRRFSRIRVGLPYANAQVTDEAVQASAYEPCRRAG